MKHKLLPLYLTQALRRFAISLLSLFTAIYLYRLLGSLSFVFLFFLVYHLSKLLTNFFAEEWSLRFGLKKEVWLGQLFWPLILGCFFLSQRISFLVYPAAVFWGISAGLYWFGRHGLMAKIASADGFGQALGKQEIFSLIPALLGPLLGGFLIQAFGYSALFATALVSILLSLLVLRPMLNKRTHIDTSPIEILKLFKTHKRMFLAYFGESAAARIYGIVFPLYLFLILKRELSIGEFFSLSLILVAVLNFLIGKLVDLKGKRELIEFGSIFSFLIWVGRFAFSQVQALFLFDVSDRVVARMTSLPLEVLTYEKALDGGSTGRAILFREMAIEMGAIFVCLALLFLNNLRLSFVLAAILTLLPLLLVRKEGIYGDGHKKT